MFGEKKSEIYDLIPENFIPKTYLIAKGDTGHAKERAEHIGYPLIAKPNIGERGIWVQKIENHDELLEYSVNCPVDFLMQELVAYPLELGVFYVRVPGEEKGKITSIVRKKFLTITGDGQTSIEKLLLKNERALLTANLQSEFLKEHGEFIPEFGLEVLVEPIGNHCRGTQFLNDNHEISDSLNSAFDQLAKQIPEFYFGRFDLRCNSYQDLSQLKNFKIIELNGAGAEPGHIYHTGYPLIKAYKDILWHLRVLADISAENKKRGFAYWTFSRGYRKWKSHQNYNRILAS